MTIYDGRNALDIRNKDGCTPLYLAVKYCRTDVLRLLIDGGAYVYIGDNDGRTLLHLAATLCDQDIVESLCENGDDVNIKIGFGLQLLIALSRGSTML